MGRRWTCGKAGRSVKGGRVGAVRNGGGVADIRGMYTGHATGGERGRTHIMSDDSDTQARPE